MYKWADWSRPMPSQGSGVCMATRGGRKLGAQMVPTTILTTLTTARWPVFPDYCFMEESI